jgi:hypothetical protein
MGEAQRRATRQLAVCLLVLGAHALVVIAFWSSGLPDRHGRLGSVETSMMVVPLELEPARQPQQTPRKHPAADVHAGRTDRAPRTAAAVESPRSGEASGSTAITPQEPPHVDWQREGEAAVEAVSPGIVRQYMRLCAEAERSHLPHPPGCPRNRYEGPWRPSGNLARDLRDPDRTRDSVPDALAPAFPQAPQSVVRVRPDP